MSILNNRILPVVILMMAVWLIPTWCQAENIVAIGILYDRAEFISIEQLCPEINLSVVRPSGFGTKNIGTDWRSLLAELKHAHALLDFDRARTLLELFGDMPRSYPDFHDFQVDVLTIKSQLALLENQEQIYAEAVTRLSLLTLMHDHQLHNDQLRNAIDRQQQQMWQGPLKSVSPFPRPASASYFGNPMTVIWPLSVPETAVEGIEMAYPLVGTRPISRAFIDAPLMETFLLQNGFPDAIRYIWSHDGNTPVVINRETSSVVWADGEASNNICRILELDPLEKSGQQAKRRRRLWWSLAALFVGGSATAIPLALPDTPAGAIAITW